MSWEPDFQWYFVAHGMCVVSIMCVFAKLILLPREVSRETFRSGVRRRNVILCMCVSMCVNVGLDVYTNRTSKLPG